MGFFDPANWQHLFSFEGVVMLLSLSLLEIVLGIDNIIFISIVAGKLPRSSQRRARFLGLSMALVFRIALLSIISWIAGLKEPLITINGFGASGRDIILFAGGLFLVIKTVMEIVEKINHDDSGPASSSTVKSFTSAIIQITLLDVIFSFDSILTAVAVSNNLVIMVIAVVIAIVIMILGSGVVSDFINKYQSIKMLALVFLVAIGMVLLLEAFHFEETYNIHLKNYVYVAMAFSLTVETLNLVRTKKARNRTLSAQNEPE